MEFLRQKRILIISPERWDHAFVSKHHYAISLANRGNTVYYLNPPTNRDAVTPLEYDDLFLVEYKQRIPGINRLPRLLQRLLTRRLVSVICAIAETEFDIVWSFDVYRLQHLDLFGAETCIYFAADAHGSITLERLVARHAHIVLSPSSDLLSTLATPAPKYFINHAVADHYLNPARRMDMPGNNKLKVGYVGNLRSHYLDFALLKAVVTANSQCDFVFAGDNSSAAMDELREFSNVFFVGVLGSCDVPAFLRGCDGLLVCYDTDRYKREASNAHKIMEYMASGRVVMGTRINQYRDRPDLFAMPQSNAALPEFVRDVMDRLPEFNDPVSQARRQAFASEHTYSRQLDRLEGLIGKIKQRLQVQ